MAFACIHTSVAGAKPGAPNRESLRKVAEIIVRDTVVPETVSGMIVSVNSTATVKKFVVKTGYIGHYLPAPDQADVPNLVDLFYECK